jgi:predicted RNase H-like HicB family nuclease
MYIPLTVELIPDPEIGGFTARLPDIPAYGEGETEDEAIADLKEALRAYIEAFGIDDARARANVPLEIALSQPPKRTRWPTTDAHIAAQRGTGGAKTMSLEELCKELDL